MRALMNCLLKRPVNYFDFNLPPECVEVRKDFFTGTLLFALQLRIVITLLHLGKRTSASLAYRRVIRRYEVI